MIYKCIALIFWMILTVILTCTIVGMILFIPKDRYRGYPDIPSSWMFIGRGLLSSIIKVK